MLLRIGKFARRLHRDEQGPNTVEWILLVFVALFVVIAIYHFARWAFGTFRQDSALTQARTDY